MGISYYANDFKAGKYVSKVENGVLKLRMQRSKEADSLQVTVRYNTSAAVKVRRCPVHFAGLLKTNLLDVKVSGGAASRRRSMRRIFNLKLRVAAR